MWVDGALWVNPPAGQILADTGQLPSGDYTVLILVTANPPGIEVVLQQRNAAGTTVLHSKVLPITLSFVPVLLPAGSIRCQAAERIVVTNRATISDGTEIEVSLFYVDLGIH